jgi:hypothetical protein
MLMTNGEITEMVAAIPEDTTVLMMLLGGPGVQVQAHIGAVSEELLNAALETDDVWVSANLSDLLDEHLEQYDEWLAPPAGLDCRLPDLTPLKQVLLEGVAKIEAIQARYAGQFHPHGE